MYTYTFSNGVCAELVQLGRNQVTGLIVAIHWTCIANGVVYGRVEIAQKPTTGEFFLVFASRTDDHSWIVGHLEGLLAHCAKHFADVKSQGQFFEREPGSTVEGAVTWEV